MVADVKTSTARSLHSGKEVAITRRLMLAQQFDSSITLSCDLTASRGEYSNKRLPNTRHMQAPPVHIPTRYSAVLLRSHTQEPNIVFSGTAQIRRLSSSACAGILLPPNSQYATCRCPLTLLSCILNTVMYQMIQTSLQGSPSEP